MSFLNLHGGSGSDEIVERLVQEHKRRSAKGIGFDAVDVDEAILQAAVLLFRDRQQQHHQETNQEPRHLPKNQSSTTPTNQEHTNVKLEKLCINNCPANPYLKYLIQSVMGMDLFEEFELQGNLEEELMNAELEAERQREVAYAAQREREQRAQDAANGEAEDDNDDAPTDEQPPANALAVEAIPEGDVGGGGGEGDDESNEDEESPESNVFGLADLGFSIRFSRRLRKLELINLPITRDHAEALMYGIETNTTLGTGCRLETLVIEGAGFVHDDDDEEEAENDAVEEDETNGNNQFENMDDEVDAMPTTSGDGTIVVKELCEGFPNNRTLKRIDLQRCSLTDAQIALIFDSLAHHPTLTSINISENACRKLGLEALDRMLVSPHWMPLSEEMSTQSEEQYGKIESLDLGYQFTSEENYGTGEHIQLDLLTRNCTTQDADIRIYPHLRKLVLQGNQIFDSDMKALAFLVRHRFPRLEELDLRFNEITTEGLEMFANHSDPNNDDFYRSSFHDNGVCNDTDSFKRYNDRLPPPSSRLRTIRLTNNPLVMNDQTTLIILKLLKIYPELQQIQSNLSWEDGTPVAEYIQHFLDINRAGRVLLLAGSSGSSNGNSQTNLPKVAASIDEHPRRRQLRQQQLAPIPMAAWPLVLGRLTRLTRYPHYIPKKNCVNSMYYLIRHGPIIMEQIASRTTTRASSGSPTKKASTSSNTSNGVQTDKNGDNEQNNRKRMRGDPALGGYATLADFLRCELGIES